MKVRLFTVFIVPELVKAAPTPVMFIVAPAPPVAVFAAMVPVLLLLRPPPARVMRLVVNVEELMMLPIPLNVIPAPAPAVVVNAALLVKSPEPMLNVFTVMLPLLLFRVPAPVRVTAPVDVKIPALVRDPPDNEIPPVTLTACGLLILKSAEAPVSVIPVEEYMPFKRVKDLFRLTVLMSLAVVALPALS